MNTDNPDMAWIALALFLIATVLVFVALMGYIKPIEKARVVLMPNESPSPCPLQLPHEPHEWAVPIQCPGIPQDGSKRPEGA